MNQKMADQLPKPDVVECSDCGDRRFVCPPCFEFLDENGKCPYCGTLYDID